LTHSSFAFTIAEEEWVPSRRLRVITRINQLLDVSAVTYPAYDATTVTAGPELANNVAGA